MSVYVRLAENQGKDGGYGGLFRNFYKYNKYTLIYYSL